MRDLNRATLIGRLGHDPELRYTGSGTAVTNIRIATDESYTDDDGNEVERTEWHRLVAWGRLAEIMQEYLGSGDRIYAEGRLQTRSWEDRDGNTRYTTEIKLSNVQFLGSPNGSGGPQNGSAGSGSGQPQGSRGAPSGGGRGAPPPSEEDRPDDDFEFEPDDELPF